MNSAKPRLLLLSEMKDLAARLAASSSPSSHPAPAPDGADATPRASGSSPGTAPETPQKADFTESDRNFLSEREQVIDARRNAFLAVGIALLEIREYRDGLFYVREFGTFERYCKKRWDFGKSHAYRLTDAAQIYRDLSPIGDTGPKRGDPHLSPIGDTGPRGGLTDSPLALDVPQTCTATQPSTLNPQLIPAETVLPAHESQLRPLKKLADPALRQRAWEAARQLSGSQPTRARHVEKAVRSLMLEIGAAPPSAKVPKPAPEPFHKISVADVKEIRSCMERFRQLARMDGWDSSVWSLFNRVDGILALAPIV